MKFKRIVSVVLCIMLLIGNAAIFVNAAGTVASGECGENVTWTLDSDGVLTFSGYGKMDDFFTSDNDEDVAPWVFYYTQIKKVVIEEGITNIGDFSFYLCLYLEEIIIPDSVKSIGDGAFVYCQSLKNITLSDGITYIGKHAFMTCTSLQSIDIPDSVTIIGLQAFTGCKALESITIGSGVKTIGYLTFAESGLKSITVDENNGYFSSEDGVLYNKAKTTLICYPAAKEDTSFSVPDGVEIISMYAFYGCSLENISIPSSVSIILMIGEDFSYCSALKNINVDINNKSYSSDNGVLYSKNKNELICYPMAKEQTAFEIPFGVKHIADNAFDSAENLVNISIPESVISIGDYSFIGCSALEEIIIPEGATSIGSNAFTNCHSLNSISIPDSVTSIGCYAFDDNAYSADANNWENGVLYIDNHLIDVDETVKNDFVVKNGTKTVSEAVLHSGNITSITIPASVTGISIPTGSKYNDSLISITVDANNEHYCSDSNVLYSKDKSVLYYYPISKENTSFDVPYGVKTIVNNAFSDNLFLESITIPDTVESIGNYAFDGCEAIVNISISDNVKSIGWDAFRNTAYYKNESNWDDNCLYIGKHLINAKMSSFGYFGGETLYIKDDTKTLAETLLNNSKLKNITVPGSITNLSDGMFAYCNLLESVNLENGILTIGTGAFQCCASLENIIIPESVESVGYGAFYDCVSLESITILNPECEILEELEDIITDIPVVLTIPENTVIYGYRNSTADEYAKKYGNTFIALDGEEDSVEINISDNENSGIQFDFSENTFDDSQGTISLEIKRDTTQSQYILMEYNKYISWNMTFYNEAGDEIQPEAPVTVKMPIPEDFNNNFLMVLHLDPQTNQGSMIDFKVEDGFVVFEASSFSVYALVDTSSEIEDEPTVNPDEPTDAPDEPAASSCDHICHKGGFMRTLWKIVRLFYKLFNLNPVCECGVAHY